MLEIIGSSFIGLLMEVFGKQPESLNTVNPVSWHDSPIFVLPKEPDPAIQAIVNQYVQGLSSKGLATGHQGVWLQTDFANLGNYQGTTPVTAASLTKIATTLAALETWGTGHRFTTLIGTNGEVSNGTLKGDLIIQGGGDPFFVWEEGIALGNALQKLGIRQVTGNLVVTGDFSMNYNANVQQAGQLLKQALDSRQWSGAVAAQYNALPSGTPRPSLAISGSVVVKSTQEKSPRILLRHQSLPLSEILKQMNIYSNNKMSEMLAQSVGGAKVVAKVAAQVAKVPEKEISLVNGSGLGLANLVSPRAACAMLLAIEEKLVDEPLGVADLFPLAGRDSHGTMINRRMPKNTAIKTGTLARVSALAGVIPTEKYGLVWFGIINHGGTIEQFRGYQDVFLQRLVKELGSAPTAIKTNDAKREWLGDPSRNLAVES